MTLLQQVCRPPVPEFKNLDWISTVVDAIVVQNKWYTPFPTTKDVKAFYLIVEQTNNGGLVETIEVEMTINGTIYTRTMAALASNDPQYMFFNKIQVLNGTASARQILALDADTSGPLETKSLQIRVRQTSVVDGVAANIEVNMVYLAVEENATVVPLITCRMYEYANLDWISTSVDAIVVLNKWYTPLPLTKNVKDVYLIIEQNNNGGLGEDLELEFTINGETVLSSNGIADGTPLYVTLNEDNIIVYSGSALQLLSLDHDQSAPLETKSLQIRIRQTTAVDVVAANIEVNMVYSVKPEIQGGQRVHEYKNLDYITTVVVDPIVINDWYTALETRRGIKAYYLIVEQNNNGAAAEDLEVELTINGIVYVASLGALVSGTSYYVNATITAAFSVFATVRQILSLDADQSAPLETKSLKIRVRQTTVVDGVSAQIEVNLVYEELQPTSTVLPQLALKHYEYKNLDYDTSGIANPVVINDWYTALDTILDGKVWYLIIEQTNNGATIETIDVELTINGVIFLRSLVGIASGALLYMFMIDSGMLWSTGGVRQLLSLDADQSAPLETKTLKVRARQTTAVDLVSAVIEVNMVYAQKENMNR